MQSARTRKLFSRRTGRTDRTHKDGTRRTGRTTDPRNSPGRGPGGGRPHSLKMPCPLSVHLCQPSLQEYQRSSLRADNKPAVFPKEHFLGMGVTPPRQRKVFSPEIDGIHKSFEPSKVSVAPRKDSILLAWLYWSVPLSTASRAIAVE